MRAFSLVELSIVLVILGLLVGGVLAGKSLIHAGELRAVSSEQQKIVTAYQAFRDKYFALPGDFSNATLVWGKNSSVCNGQSGTATTPGTCNGNADTQILYISTVQHEHWRQWQHLSLAGFIEGTYSGTQSSDVSKPSQNSGEIGENMPASKFPNAGWDTRYYDTGSGDGTYFAGIAGNLLFFVGDDNNGNPATAIMTTEDAWNVDTKMDDGMPGTGKLFGMPRNNCTTASSASDFTGAYKLNTTGTLCALYWKNQF